MHIRSREYIHAEPAGTMVVSQAQEDRPDTATAARQARIRGMHRLQGRTDDMLCGLFYIILRNPNYSIRTFW